MPQLYLPAAHTDADLVLAGQIAEQIDSGELHVAWTREHGHAVPEVAAELRVAVPRRHGTLGLVIEVVRVLWSAARRRGAAAQAASA